jgi:hypothetical protein
MNAVEMPVIIRMNDEEVIRNAVFNEERIDLYIAALFNGKIDDKKTTIYYGGNAFLVNLPYEEVKKKIKLLKLLQPA